MSSSSLMRASEEAPQQGLDLAATTRKHEATARIEGQVFMARQFPRNEDQAYQSIMRSCERFNFATGASYNYPRGGQRVIGPSIQLAQDIKRCWGNILSGVRQARDEAEFVVGEAYAWDVQTNAYVSREFQVSKYTWRKGKNGSGGHAVKYDNRTADEDSERTFREKFFNIGARAEREMILKLVPPDFVEDAMEACEATVAKGIKDDPERARKNLLRAFAKIAVTAEMLEEYLGVKPAQASPKQLADLRNIYSQINSGETTWQESTSGEKEPEKPKGTPDSPTGSINLDNLKKSADENRGHDATAAETKAPEPETKAPETPRFTLTAGELNLIKAFAEDQLLDSASLARNWKGTKKELLEAARDFNNKALGV